MDVATNPVLVEALRGETRESDHRGAIAVVDAEGAVVASLGDIERPIFPRSAVKALQAIPLIEGGAADRLQLDDQELAIVCASHNGEPEHLAVVERLLAKTGLDLTALECGSHWPSREPMQRAMAARGETPTSLHNNCSGKHAGFLALGCALCAGVDLRQYVKGYVAPRHPVMRAVTAALQTVTGYDLERTARGIDGCSIPTYAIPLRHLAHGFARFGSGKGSAAFAAAARRLREAVARQPFMVGGSRRFDTNVMTQFGERVFCKVGAEGVFCAALPERGLGVALKIDDGHARAAETTMAAAIEALLELDAADRSFIGPLAAPTLRNWNEIEVGALRVSDSLREALVAAR